MGSGNEAMLAGARSGDREAFEALYRRFRPLVFSAAHRITGDAHEAEDVVQETFLEVHEALPRWRPEARVSTWIWRIAVNKALDERRRAKRRPVTGEVPEPAVEAARGDATVAERIREAVAGLPARERAVFVLRHYQEMPLAEVAEVLDVAVGTVKAALHHALAKLSARLRDLR